MLNIVNAMKRTKRFRIPLSEGDIVDVKLEIEGGTLIGFVLNLRCKIEDVWRQVYRVDTVHGYLHEQRFWISSEPIPLCNMRHCSTSLSFTWSK